MRTGLEKLELLVGADPTPDHVCRDRERQGRHLSAAGLDTVGDSGSATASNARMPVGEHDCQAIFESKTITVIIGFREACREKMFKNITVGDKESCPRSAAGNQPRRILDGYSGRRRSGEG